MLKSSLIIPYFNGSKWLRACLDSIANDAAYIEQIYVINDASKCNEVSNICANYPKVKLIINTKNLGFGATCNKGAELALQNGAEAIILLNQDTKFSGPMLSKLVSTLALNKNLSLVAPISCDYDTNEIEDFFIEWYLRFSEKLKVDLNSADKLDPYYKVKFILGACIAFRTSLVKQIGLFDPLFSLYCEDHDLCRRINLAGGEIAIVPTAKISHYHNNAKGLPENINLKKFKSELLYELKDPERTIKTNLIETVRLFKVRTRIDRKDRLYISFIKKSAVFVNVILLLPRTLIRRLNERKLLTTKPLKPV